MARDLLQVNIKCDSVLNTVRTSGLNFSCQETPYSLYLTLRKSFTQPRYDHQVPHPNHHQAEQDAELDRIKSQYEKILEDYKHLELAYNYVKGDFEDAIAETQSNYRVIANLNETIEKYSKAAEENKSDQTDAVKVEPLDRYEPKKKLKTSESEKESEPFSLETIEFEAKVDLNYNVPVSNKFSVLENSSVSEPKVLSATVSSEIGASSPPRTTSSIPSPPSPRTPSRSPPVNNANYVEAFTDFLENFCDEASDTPKYRDFGKDMMKNNCNVFHIKLKDVRKFSRNLGGFMAANYQVLEKEFAAIIQIFLEKLELGDLRHGLHVYLHN